MEIYRRNDEDRLSREDPIGTCGRDGNTDDGSPESAGIQFYMSDPSDFYRKFILELVPNNAFNDSWFCKDLRPVQPMHLRIGTVIVHRELHQWPGRHQCHVQT